MFWTNIKEDNMEYKRRIIWLLLVVTCHGRTTNQPEQRTNQGEPQDVTTEAAYGPATDYLDSILFQIGGAVGPGWNTDDSLNTLSIPKTYDSATVNVFDQNNIQNRGAQQSLTEEELEKCAEGFSYRSGLEINCPEITTTPNNQEGSTNGQNNMHNVKGSTTEDPIISQHDDTKTTPSTIPIQSTTSTKKPMVTQGGISSTTPMPQIGTTTSSSIMLPSPPLNPSTQGTVTPATPNIIPVSQSGTVPSPNTSSGFQVHLYPTPSGIIPINTNPPINQGNFCGGRPCGQNNGPFQPGSMPNQPNWPNWGPWNGPQHHPPPMPAGFWPHYGNVPPMRPDFMPFGGPPPMFPNPFGHGPVPYAPTGMPFGQNGLTPMRPLGSAGFVGVQPMPAMPAIVLNGWPFQDKAIAFGVNGIPPLFPGPHIRVANSFQTGWNMK